MADPAIIQQADNRWPGQNALGDPQSLTETLAMPGNVTAGNTMVVFAVQFNAGGVGGTIAITDTLSNTYTKRAQVDDDDGSANLSVYVFTAPITSGGACTLTGTFSQLEWQALFAMEVSNLTGSVLATSSNVQTATSTTADSLTSGSLVAGAFKGIVLSVCVNATDQNAANGGGVGSPNVGTGWTAINSGIIDWNGEENSFVGPACQPQYKVYSSSIGTVTPTYTPKKAAESYVSLSIALQATVDTLAGLLPWHLKGQMGVKLAS